ncbi:MAG: hypothetical protein ACLFSE_05705 [Spirochaetia bacterium]
MVGRAAKTGQAAAVGPRSAVWVRDGGGMASGCRGESEPRSLVFITIVTTMVG